MSYDDIIYTQEEVEAMRKTKSLILDISFQNKFKKYFSETYPFTEDNISKRHLAVTVIVSKCRPEEAAEKYIKWVGVLQEWGIMELSEDQLLNPPKGSDEYLRNYAQCGRDIHGRRIFWICGGAKPIPNDMAEEKKSLYAALRYYMALHSDAKTLREGLTFVIDLTHKGSVKEGNESRMQRAHNAYPLRPQNIYIVGASMAVRVSVNALLRIAALTTRVKILRRIKFVNVDGVLVENGGVIPKESLPTSSVSMSTIEDIGDVMKKLDIHSHEDEEEKKVDDPTTALRMSHTTSSLQSTSSSQSTSSLKDWVNQSLRSLPLPNI